MEADWAAAVGAGLEVIDADWAGFVDLRGNPEAIGLIAEAAESVALREALLLLNGTGSPVFTCKCDVWTLAAEEIDPREFDYEPGLARVGVASYIDLVGQGFFGSFEKHEAWGRGAVLRMRALAVRDGRADLVIRAAVCQGAAGFGITLYAAGCGVDTQAARAAWEAILRVAVAVTMEEARSYAAGE